MPLSPEQFKFLNAAAQGDAQTVRAMLAAGVDVDTPDNRSFPRQRTALMHAAERGHAEVVDVLLAAGATLDLKDKGFGVALPGGNTALLLALKNKHARIALRLLEANASPNVTSGGVTVFSLAANLGDSALVRRLLEMGFSPNKSASKRADLPLASALYARQTEIVRLLVSAKANPNARAARGVRPLEIAIREGLDEAAKLLLHHGANPNRVCARGLTPLMIAALCGQMEIVRALLERGAKANARTRRGRTALDLVREKLDAMNAPDSAAFRPETPASAADRKVCEEIIRLLQNAGKACEPLPAEPPAPSGSVAPAEQTVSPPAILIEPAPPGIADFLELLQYGEPEFSVVAVKAPLEGVAAAFGDLRKPKTWHRDVPRHVATKIRPVRASAIALVEVAGNPWTVIYRSMFRLGPGDMKLAVEDANELSTRLATRAISFIREQTAQAVGYDFFENGKVIEHAQWLEQSSICWFKSRYPRKPKKDELGEDFTGKVFRQQGIYLPACFPQVKKDEAWLCVERVSAPAIQRADIMILPRIYKPNT